MCVGVGVVSRGEAVSRNYYFDRWVKSITACLGVVAELSTTAAALPVSLPMVRLVLLWLLACGRISSLAIQKGLLCRREELAGRMYVLTRGRGLGGDDDRVQVLIAHQCAHDIIIWAVASKMDE